MADSPRLRRRRSPRLKAHDYAAPGAYFVTIVTQDRCCLFGEITDGAVQLNGAGEAVKDCWLELKKKFTTVLTDEFVVMPNHFHGIIIIKIHL